MKMQSQDDKGAESEYIDSPHSGMAQESAEQKTPEQINDSASPLAALPDKVSAMGVYRQKFGGGM